MSLARGLACAASLAPLPALAVQSCDIDGQPVNPNNGYTTQGKSGLMRCRDGEGGPVLREQELKNGVFMGVVRSFKGGVLEREYRVNERGNRDGLAREYAASPAADGAKPVLVSEETQRDGRTVGLARTWFAAANMIRRVAFHGDDGVVQASASFDAQGRLTGLQCADRPLLGPDADDAHWCGHAGGPATVLLHDGKGQPRSRWVYERGQQRRSEILGDRGEVRELRETGPSGGLERSFAADGTKRREVQWLLAERRGSEGARRITTLDQEFHESGKLVRERRWRPVERRGEPVSEQRWYLNGQPKELTEFVSGDGRALRKETTFHDNGRKSSEGLWLVAAAGSRGGDLATGVHKSWDADARLRAERSYDERGRITRERDFDAGGVAIRDDEVFEDGSRKAAGK